MIFYQAHKLYKFPVVVAASSLILIIFVIYPQISSLLSNQKTQDETLGKISVLEAKAQALESYDPADLNLRVSYALNVYPAEKDFMTAIGILQKLTSKLGFEISSLALGSAGSNKLTNAQSFNIKLDITGPEAMLNKLLKDIESSPRLMRINSLEVNSSRQTGAGAAALVVDVLFAQAPSGFGSIDSPLPELSSKEQEIIQKLARFSSTAAQSVVKFGPRGKENPFE